MTTVFEKRFRPFLILCIVPIQTYKDLDYPWFSGMISN